jgi:hypothetical protein
MDSFINEDSLMKPQDAGREFFALLDAIYEANRRTAS